MVCSCRGDVFIRWILRFPASAAMTNLWVNFGHSVIYYFCTVKEALRTGKFRVLALKSCSSVACFGTLVEAERVKRKEGAMKYKKAFVAAMFCCCISISRLVKRRFVAAEQPHVFTVWLLPCCFVKPVDACVLFELKRKLVWLCNITGN